MDFLRTNKNAQWLVPVVAGVFSCACSCGVMFCLFATVVMPANYANVPPDQAFQYGLQLGQHATPAQQLFSLAMYCVPPLLFVVVGIAAFLWLRSYQKRNAPPMPFTPGVSVNVNVVQDSSERKGPPAPPTAG
jgi:hypothetical protein